MIIFLGSTRPAKVDGTREAIAAIASVDERFRGAEIRARDLGDAGPRMPMSEAEIIDGARRRALAVIEGEPEAGVLENAYAVGLEGGLDPLPLESGTAGYTLKTWACVSDGRRWSYGAGGGIVVPEAVAAEVLGGHELGDVIDRLAGAGVRGTRGGWGVLTRDLISRRDAFRLAVLSAFAPFYNKEAYSTYPQLGKVS